MNAEVRVPIPIINENLVHSKPKHLKIEKIEQKITPENPQTDAAETKPYGQSFWDSHAIANLPGIQREFKDNFNWDIESNISKKHSLVFDTSMGANTGGVLHFVKRRNTDENFTLNMSSKKTKSINDEDSFIIKTDGNFDGSVNFTLLGKLYERKKRYHEQLNDADDWFLISSKRRIWLRRFDFFIVCVCYSLSVPILWRFTVFCALYGNSIFILFYILLYVAVGFPLLLMKSVICQFSHRGFAQCWYFAVAFRGIGYCYLGYSVVSLFYFQLNNSYLCMYIFFSVRLKQPWLSCDNEWNDKSCMEFIEVIDYFHNESFSTPSQQFYSHMILQNVSIDKIGPFHLRPFNFFLFFTYFICCYLELIALCFKINLSSKIYYFFITLPYSFFLLLIASTFTLAYNREGIINFFVPNFNALYNTDMWYSLIKLVTTDALIVHSAISTLASYNEFSHRIKRSLLKISSFSFFTIFMLGISFFQLKQFYFKHSKIQESEFLSQNFNNHLLLDGAISFFSQIWLAHLWNFMFLVTLLVLGFCNTLTLLEIINSAILDLWPCLRHRGPLVCRLHLLLAVTTSLLGVFFFTGSGQYLVILLERILYGSGPLLLCLVELISLFVVYGRDNVSTDILVMTGQPLSRIIRYYYCFFLIPLILLLLVYSDVVPHPYKTYYGVQPKYTYLIEIASHIVECLVLGVVVFYIVYIGYHRRAKPVPSSLKAKWWFRTFEESIVWGPGFAEIWQKHPKYQLKIHGLRVSCPERMSKVSQAT